MLTIINKMRMYILGFGLNGRHLKKNIFSTNENSSSNICPIASWLVYSENYINFKQKYHINEMYAALIEKPNVYLVVANHICINGTTELDVVATYIKEHYLIDKVKIEEVVNFNNEIYIYKLTK